MTSHPRGLRLVTVSQAATVLGVAETEIRKLVQQGRLKGELVLRPEGSSLMVTLAPDLSQALVNEDVAALTLASNEAMLAALNAPLWAELAASHKLARDQFNQVLELARENGRLRAEAAYDEARADQLEAECARLTAEIAALRAEGRQHAARQARRAGIVAVGAIWAVGVGLLVRRIVRPG